MVIASGEPLVRRIQRQLFDRGFENIVLMCATQRVSDYLLDARVTHCIPPVNHDRIRNNSTAWAYREHFAHDGNTILLFADTYYTDAFMDSLASNADREFLVYGRRARSKTHHSNAFETFAIVLSQSGLSTYLGHLETAIQMHTALISKHPDVLTMMMYRSMRESLWPDMNAWWLEWSDETEDFDTSEDWWRMHKHFPAVFPHP